MTLTDLIAALERADGPGFVLDEAVEAFRWKDVGVPAPYPPKPYTSSIDAALTLYKRKPAWISSNPLEVCMEALVQHRDDDAALKARGEG